MTLHPNPDPHEHDVEHHAFCARLDELGESMRRIRQELEDAAKVFEAIVRRVDALESHNDER